MLFPDAWERFLAPIPPRERHDLIGAYHRRLTGADRREQARAAEAWSQWEGDTLSLRGPRRGRPSSTETDFAVAFARIECHFFANRGFFEEDGWLLKNVAAIRHIPGWDRPGPLRCGHASGERLVPEGRLAGGPVRDRLGRRPRLHRARYRRRTGARHGRGACRSRGAALPLLTSL